MDKPLLLLAGLAGLPWAGTAQTAQAPAHFYLGLGASVLTDSPFKSYHSPAIFGPALTAGLQLGPRFGLQLGAGYGQQHQSYSSYYSSGGSASTPDAYTDEFTTKVFTVPLLARLTFTAPAARFRADALAGFTLVHSGTRSTYTSFSGGQVIDNFQNNSNRNSVSFSLGPAVRYALTPRIELAVSAVASAALNGSYYGSFNDRLFLNTLAGGHYTFGHR